MSTLESLGNAHQRGKPLSRGEDVIPQKTQQQGDFTSNWSIPATHGSPNIPIQTKQSPHTVSQRSAYSKLASVFEDLDRQCQERSSKVESNAKEALRTQLTAWIKSRETLYLAQLRDASEHFRKTTIAVVKQRQAAELSQALVNEKVKFADEYHSKLKEVQYERDQVVQRRLELVRQMEEAAAALVGRRSKEDHLVEENSSREVNMQNNVTDNREVSGNGIMPFKMEANHGKEELAAAVQARDEALESLEIARNLQQKAVSESRSLKQKYEDGKRSWERDIAAYEQSLKEFETAAEGACAKISSLKAELKAVQFKLTAQEENDNKLSESERNMLVERAAVAEAAAAAAEEAKKELERCSAAAEVARTAADSQAFHLRHRLEELIKENSALQRGMVAAEEAVQAACSAEKATAADRAGLVEKVTATKEALATHRAAISQLEIQLKEERTQREALKTVAQNAAMLQIKAAAWEEKTLRHAEDTRLRLAAALRDIEAVCLAARALGQFSASNTKYSAPLFHTIKESEDHAAEAAAWLREAQIEGKALASSAPYCSSSPLLSSVDCRISL
ncbi:hypothetical protein Ndes2526B_g01999 [Nannochloris sp. 'desiccata']|nr:hypothetical protein NADE_002741 [Chlorella desiccata (nom. nud.)]